VLEADLILHVRDISHPETAEQAADVGDILTSLGVNAATPLIEVWNKLDLVEGVGRAALVAQAAGSDRVFAISALTGEGLPRLFEAVSAALDEEKTDATLILPFAEGRRRAWLHDQGVVLQETEAEEGWSLAIRWTARQQAAFRAL
jgi:GTPase